MPFSNFKSVTKQSYYPAFYRVLFFKNWTLLERNFRNKIYSNPKSGIFSGSFFASIPTLNPMFWKVWWLTVSPFWFFTKFTKILLFCFDLKGWLQTNKLKLFQWKISKHQNTPKLKRYDAPWLHKIFHFLGLYWFC